MKVTERLLVEIIQNDPKTAISSHSKRPKLTKKDLQNPITVSRVGHLGPTLDKNVNILYHMKTFGLNAHMEGWWEKRQTKEETTHG